MNILTITRTPWDRSSSIGNTFSNLFKGIKYIKFYNICCQPGSINYEIVTAAYKMSDKTVLKSIIGQDAGYVETKLKTNEAHNDRNHKLAKLNLSQFTFAHIIRDLIWKFGKWRNKDLDKFIDLVRPDMIYAPLYHSLYMSDVLLYIVNKFRIPLVLFICDDVYSYPPSILRYPLKYLYKYFLRKKINILINKCLYAEVYAQEMQKEYSDIFNKQFYLTSKGIYTNKMLQPIEGKQSVRKKNINFTYTGGIGGERYKQLLLFAELIESKFAKKELNAQLHIFTSTKISKSSLKKFQKYKCVVWHGEVDNKEIDKLQRQADYLIHVEGFSKKTVFETRLSFSTKLIDYMNSQTPIIALGPSTINSIKILGKFNLAHIATSKDELSYIIQRIANDEPLPFDNNRLKANVRKYLIKHCDLSNIQESFINRVKKYISTTP